MRASLCALMIGVALMAACAAAHGERAELVPRAARWIGASVVLSHDGRLLATFQGNRLDLWDSVRGLPIRSFACERREILDVPEGVRILERADAPSFSPDGRYVAATVSNYPKLVRDGYLVVPCVWDLASGASLTEGTWRYVAGPDGEPALQSFPVGLSEPWRWREARDAAAMERLARYTGFADAVSADGRFAASAAPDDTSAGKRPIRLWRLADASSFGVIELETNRIQTLRFSPDGRWLVSQDFDRQRWRLTVWDVESGEAYKTLVNDEAFHGITFSPDGRWLSLARARGKLILYDLASWEVVWTHPELEGSSVAALTFSRDGTILAVITRRYDPKIEIWQTDEWAARARFDTAGLAPVTSLALSPNGRTLAVGSYESEFGLLPSRYGQNGLTGLWSLQSGGAPRRLEEDASIRDVAFSLDGERIATGSQDDTNEGRSSGTREGQVTLWDVETEESRALLDGERQWSTPSPDYPDQQEIVIPASSATKTAFIPESGDLVAGVYRLSAGRWEGITWVEFESDVRLTFWDSQNGAVLKTIDTGRAELYALAVSPDGRTLATGHEEGRLLLWDVATGENLSETERNRSARRMDAVAFHPDGSALFSGDSRGRLSVWNPRSGELIRQLNDHPEGVRAIAFDATGALLATASCSEYGPSTGRFRLSSASSHDVRLERDGCPTALRFSTDGRFLIVGDRDGVTRFHDVDTGEVVVSLSLHPNIDAWLVWTPEGLYDGNEEGIRRILVWRRDTDVRRLTAFPSRYHVTDLLPKVLSGTAVRPNRPITELSAPDRAFFVSSRS